MTTQPKTYEMFEMSTGNLDWTSVEQLRRWHPIDEGPFRILEYEYGYVVFVPDQETLDDYRGATISPVLKGIVQEAITRGCRVIVFDRDADADDYWTVHDW